MESRRKYGLLGAGAVSGSLIGKLPSRRRDLGPVCAVSYRVASRIANTLRAGYPVRSADELNTVRAILVHAPSEHSDSLLELLGNAAIDWTGKALILCDCYASLAMRRRFEEKGAKVAVAQVFGVPARIIAEGGEGSAIRVVRRLARDMGLKAVRIAPESADRFDAGVTLASAGLTPLIDRAVALLRGAGIRDVEAVRMASSLFEQTARDYAHSGRQSWAWYARKPEARRLEAQIESAGAVGAVLRELVLFGFETFGKHGDVGEEIKSTGDRIAGGT